MANPFFNALVNNRGNNPMQMLLHLKSDPAEFLASRGFNIPKNAKNPQEILQALLDNGQISQQQINKAQEMARSMGLR